MAKFLMSSDDLLSVDVGEGDGVGVEVGVTAGVGVGIGSRVATGIGEGFATGLITMPLFQTSFLPDLMHMNFLLATTDVAPTLLHLDPALTAPTAEAPLSKSTQINRKEMIQCLLGMPKVKPPEQSFSMTVCTYDL